MGHGQDPANVVVLNVGGLCFTTYRSTLLSKDSSFFKGLIDSSPPHCQEFFVDRDPTYFRFVLNWLRGVRYLPDDDDILQELLWEADYFNLPDLCKAIAGTKDRHCIRRSVAGVHREPKT